MLSPTGPSRSASPTLRTRLPSALLHHSVAHPTGNTWSSVSRRISRKPPQSGAERSPLACSLHTCALAPPHLFPSVPSLSAAGNTSSRRLQPQTSQHCCSLLLHFTSHPKAGFLVFSSRHPVPSLSCSAGPAGVLRAGPWYVPCTNLHRCHSHRSSTSLASSPLLTLWSRSL